MHESPIDRCRGWVGQFCIAYVRNALSRSRERRLG